MDNFKTITAVTKAADPKIASQEIAQQFAIDGIDFVLFFCASTYPLAELAQALDQAFNDIPVVGCTTAGELSSEGYQHNSVVAIAFSEEYFSINATLVKSMDNFNSANAEATIEELNYRCQNVIRARNGRHKQHSTFNNNFILTLLDGLSAKEEQFLFTLHAAARGIAQFGGSTGDGTILKQTHVYYQGAFYPNAAIIIMVNTPLHFEVFSCQHIKKPLNKLVVTSANAQTRTVHELNAEPAALEYAKLLNMEVDDLNSEVFALYPLSVKIGEHYYIRSIQKVNKEDLSLTFYCAVDIGIVLTSIELGDIFQPVEDKLNEISLRYGAPELVMTCDCCLRRIEIEHKGLEQQVKTLNQKYNVTGFNTYGEHLDGIHLNQTYTGVFIAGEIND